MAAVVVLLVLNGLVAFNQIRRLRLHTNRVEQSHVLRQKLDSIESAVITAEAGQRGFLITGQESYLDQYQETVKTVDSLVSQLLALTEADPAKADIAIAIQPLIRMKMEELASTIIVRRNAGFEEVRRLVAKNIGKRTMDSISKQVDQLRQIENRLISDREATAATTYGSVLLTSLMSTIVSLILVVAVLYLVQRNRQRAEQAEATIRREHEQLQASLDRNTILELENQRMGQYVRTIVEQVQDYAIFGMDDQCRAITWNEGVRQVLGFDESEFVGKDVRQLIFTPEASELGIPTVEFATAAQEGRASDDRWMMRKGGTRFWASGITSAVKDADGNVIGFSKVMRDLTERKRDEDEMAELATKLSEMNRRKNEFLATLAHELRNPLAPIKNAVQLMSMSESRPENMELHDTIARQVEQMIRLIDDLLDVSRIGHGKLTLHKDTINLRAVIASAIEASSTFITEKDQRLETTLCDSEVLVYADPARLTQVVSNLLNNSSRYSDSNANISLTLSIDCSQSSEGVACIVVEDDGVGLSSDRLEDIFHMFSQVPDSQGRGDAGLGIGLTLVKALVELHGGTVAAHSDGVGRGSRFTVSIPLAPKNAVAASAEAASRSPVDARPFRVLVVEDMRALRMVMSRLLERMGHEVRVSEDGLSALETLTEFDAEVIFSDIAMPGMTGNDLARKLREHPDWKGTYLVAMSGYGQLSDQAQSRESGFDEHMVKPVDIVKLRELFEKLTQAFPSTS
ncbi:Aerobic respiration control sensor protein ArcB [Aureliella helgolandensis]|uniref:histidine kinase n=1 Tax=Aureliella helgolandensis TaxID=2527968 RepID=A0A518GFR4_9BACT|nr:Aerobic respiration control sensor protein ArcB [Aureliella helgolandensis]